jgi:hypothetical protein
MASAYEIARDILVAWISSEKMMPISGKSNEETATRDRPSLQKDL